MKYLTLTLLVLVGCEGEFIDLGPDDVQDAEISGDEIGSDAELDAPVDDAVEAEEMEVEPDADTVDTEPLDVAEAADESADVPDEVDVEVDADADADADADGDADADADAEAEAEAEADGYDDSSMWWGVPGGPCDCDSDCWSPAAGHEAICWYHICVWLTPTPCVYGRPWEACGAPATYCITTYEPTGNICVPVGGCDGPPWSYPANPPCLTGICDDRTYPDACVPSNDSIAAGDCDASCSSYCLPGW